MIRPVVLDLCCRAGGASVGYYRAGFDVVGVDIEPQQNYPFEFHRDDALRWLDWPYLFKDFDLIHASPPCQKYSTLAALHKQKVRADLVPAFRRALIATGKPWIMENVPTAKLDTATILCGSMFGLGAWCADGSWHQLRRHRAFESPFMFFVQPCSHAGRPVGVYGNGGGNASRGHRKGVNGFTGKASERREAMGIDWMSCAELSEAIPPAYTEFLGDEVLKQWGLRVATSPRPNWSPPPLDSSRDRKRLRGQTAAESELEQPHAP